MNKGKSNQFGTMTKSVTIPQYCVEPNTLETSKCTTKSEFQAYPTHSDDQTRSQHTHRCKIKTKQQQKKTSAEHILSYANKTVYKAD